MNMIENMIESQSKRNGDENPPIKNWIVGNVSPNSASVITKTSIFPRIIVFIASNLFLSSIGQ